MATGAEIWKFLHRPTEDMLAGCRTPRTVRRTAQAGTPARLRPGSTALLGADEDLLGLHPRRLRDLDA
jgi:hypothetical protein